jgi:Brp/Blh family beta-carotene 15,15'-monooxygenase
MTHSLIIAISSLLLGFVSAFGVGPSQSVLIVSLIAAVGLIGIPHGGLDHWTGRRLLHGRFPRIWSILFFSAYFAVGLIVVAGWSLSPVITAVSFFLVSAWHFGVEEDRFQFSSQTLDSLAAVAVGGMLIWIPILIQPDRVEAILTSLIPQDWLGSASKIVAVTRWFAICLLPVAATSIVLDLGSSEGQVRSFRHVCFAGLFCFADVLLSFGVYFCTWHSLRGLMRLGREHGMRITEVAVHALPLTIAACALGGVGLWVWSSGTELTSALEKTLFITLSSLAVPHMVLHGPWSEGLRVWLHAEPAGLECAEVPQ